MYAIDSTSLQFYDYIYTENSQRNLVFDCTVGTTVQNQKKKKISAINGVQLRISDVIRFKNLAHSDKVHSSIIQYYHILRPYNIVDNI